MDYQFIIKGQDSLEEISQEDFIKAATEVENVTISDTLEVNAPNGFSILLPLKENEKVADYYYADDKKVTYHLKNGIVILIYEGGDKDFYLITEKLAQLMNAQPYSEANAMIKFEQEIFERSQ